MNLLITNTNVNLSTGQLCSNVNRINIYPIYETPFLVLIRGNNHLDIVIEAVRTVKTKARITVLHGVRHLWRSSWWSRHCHSSSRTVSWSSRFRILKLWLLDCSRWWGCQGSVDSLVDILFILRNLILILLLVLPNLQNFPINNHCKKQWKWIIALVVPFGSFFLK